MCSLGLHPTECSTTPSCVRIVQGCSTFYLGNEYCTGLLSSTCRYSLGQLTYADPFIRDVLDYAARGIAWRQISRCYWPRAPCIPTQVLHYRPFKVPFPSGGMLRWTHPPPGLKWFARLPPAHPRLHNTYLGTYKVIAGVGWSEVSSLVAWTTHARGPACPLLSCPHRRLGCAYSMEPLKTTYLHDNPKI